MPGKMKPPTTARPEGKDRGDRKRQKPIDVGPRVWSLDGFKNTKKGEGGNNLGNPAHEEERKFPKGRGRSLRAFMNL